MAKPVCYNCHKEGQRKRGCLTCKRIESEKRWIRKFVRAVISKGGYIAVDYGEGDDPLFISAETTVMGLVHACDEECLRVKFADGTTSHVYCVYGNADDGSEVFSDWGMRCNDTLVDIGYIDQ